MQRLSSMICLMIAGLGLFAKAAHADVKTLEAAKVSIDTPAGWKVEQQGEDYTMLGPNEEVWIIVQVSDDADTTKALSNADAFLNKIASDVRWSSKPKEVQTNGMKSFANRAKAKIAKKDVLIAVLVVKTPANKTLTMLRAVDAKKEADYTAILKKFIESIKPA